MTITFDAHWIPWFWTALCLLAGMRTMSRAQGYDFAAPMIFLLWLLAAAIGWAVYFGVT